MAHLQNPYVIAQAIRALDSHLISIEIEIEVDRKGLIYCFEVAGYAEQFYVPLTDMPVHSISMLYPMAKIFEIALQSDYGIEFRS